MKEEILVKYDTEGIFAKMGLASEKLEGNDKQAIYKAMSELANAYAEISRFKDLLKGGIGLVAKERWEQIHKHNRTTDFDARYYQNGELLQAAMFCISTDELTWPEGWDEYHKNKILSKDKINQLRVAGAFIAAEIDRLLNSEQGAKVSDTSKVQSMDEPLLQNKKY